MIQLKEKIKNEEASIFRTLNVRVIWLQHLSLGASLQKLGTQLEECLSLIGTDCSSLRGYMYPIRTSKQVPIFLILITKEGHPNNFLIFSHCLNVCKPWFFLNLGIYSFFPSCNCSIFSQWRGKGLFYKERNSCISSSYKVTVVHFQNCSPNIPTKVKKVFAFTNHLRTDM